MIINKYSWKTADGLKVYAKTWEPENQTTKGIITLVHGMGEHIDRYDPFAQILTDQGYAILAYDQRGHGQTEGNRGHSPSYDHLLDDLTIAVQKTKELLPAAPHFIYGHSMGGGLATNYLIRKQPDFKAAILSAPYYRLTHDQPAIKLKLGRLTQNLVPKLTLPNGLNPDHISRDKNEVEKYLADPLVHNKISAKMGISIVDAGEYAITHAKEIKTPALILHGTGDEITSAEASQILAEKTGGIVQMKGLDGLYHEIHHEPEKEKVFEEIIQYLNSKLQYNC